MVLVYDKVAIPAQVRFQSFKVSKFQGGRPQESAHILLLSLNLFLWVILSKAKDPSDAEWLSAVPGFSTANVQSNSTGEVSRFQSLGSS